MRADDASRSVSAVGSTVGPFPAERSVVTRSTEELVSQLEAEADQGIAFSATVVFELARRALAAEQPDAP
jgi:hypothetical protein